MGHTLHDIRMNWTLLLGLLLLLQAGLLSDAAPAGGAGGAKIDGENLTNHMMGDDEEVLKREAETLNVEPDTDSIEDEAPENPPTEPRGPAQNVEKNPTNDLSAGFDDPEVKREVEASNVEPDTDSIQGYSIKSSANSYPRAQAFARALAK